MKKEIHFEVRCNRCGSPIFSAIETFDVSKEFSWRFNITDSLMAFVALGCSREGGGEVCHNRHFFICITAVEHEEVVEDRVQDEYTSPTQNW